MLITYNYKMAVRITLDWDFKNKLKLIWYLFKVIKLKPMCFIVEKSRSKGFHVQIWLTGKMSQKKKDIIRRKLGEDPAHLRMDKKHRYGKQTLFDIKKRV